MAGRAKISKQDKLHNNKMDLVFIYIWMGLSVVATLWQVGRQLFETTRVPMNLFLGTLWIPVLSLCMSFCLMVNKLLDNKILLELIAMENYTDGGNKRDDAE